MRIVTTDEAVNKALRISNRKEWPDLRALPPEESKTYG